MAVYVDNFRHPARVGRITARRHNQQQQEPKQEWRV